FRFHLCQTTVNVDLLQLEVRNAIAQEAANAVALLEYGDRVTRTNQLLGAGEPRGARAHNGDALAGLAAGRLWCHPAFLPASVDNGMLDGLDAHRVIIDGQRAGRLARSGADAAGELGEVVRGMQHVQRTPPVLPIHEVVPVRNNIIDRASACTEGD